MNEYLVHYVTQKGQALKKKEMTLKAEDKGHAYAKFMGIQEKQPGKERVLEAIFLLVFSAVENKTIH